MRLYIMRHGKAEHHLHGQADAERSLTKTGRHQARDSGKWLLGQGLEGAPVVASPYRRAQETAAIVAERLGVVGVDTQQLLEPDGDVRQVTAWLAQRQVPALIVVSHMPLVSQLAGWLEDGVLAGGDGFATGQVLALELEEVGAAQARRLALHRPAD